MPNSLLLDSRSLDCRQYDGTVLKGVISAVLTLCTLETLLTYFLLRCFSTLTRQVTKTQLFSLFAGTQVKRFHAWTKRALCWTRTITAVIWTPWRLFRESMTVWNETWQLFKTKWEIQQKWTNIQFQWNYCRPPENKIHCLPAQVV